MKTFSLCIVAALLLTACRSAKNIGSSSSLRLKFLGEFLLPQNLEFQQTKIGGLSSIDYDPVNDLYYLISDDRSERNPARFYTAKINLSEKGISSVDFVGVTSLLQKNGSLYPGRLHDSVNYPDPEALRLNQKTGTFVWASEGERLLKNGEALFKNPSVNLMKRDGQWIDSFLLPSNLQVSAAAFGPRRNGAFEGLAFSPEFESLFVSIEEPLYQDGPRAGQGDSTAFTRMIRYDMRSKKPTAQYAYQIDAVVKPPMPTGAFSVNGVVDILSINKSQVLVTERSYSTGFTGCNVRVYIADLHNVTDVSRVESLSASQKVNLIEKRLVLDMDKLGLTIHNIEGASFGPRLPNGKRTLLFVADDNFSAAERTQFLLFAVDE